MIDLGYLEEFLREWQRVGGMSLLGKDYAFDDYYSAKNFLDRHRGRKTSSGRKKKRLMYETQLIEEYDHIKLTYHNNLMCKFYPTYNQYFSTGFVDHSSTSRRFAMTGVIPYRRKLHTNSPTDSVYLCRHLMNSRLRVFENGLKIGTREQGQSLESKVESDPDSKLRLEEYLFRRFLTTKSAVNNYFSFHKDLVGFDISLLVRKEQDGRLRWMATFYNVNNSKNALLRTKEEDVEIINELLSDSFVLTDSNMNYGIIELTTSMRPKEYLQKLSESKEPMMA